jgi:transcriptional regulator with XRE-family HTH domain
MDPAFLIRQRLEELGLEQRDLAKAAQVTESYISQLLTRKKGPPAPDRTDLYEKLDKVLQLPRGELARLAERQRREELKRALDGAPAALFPELRELILRKCRPEKAAHVRPIVETQPFGELERLVTQRLLEVAKGVAKEELDNEQWLRRLAEPTGGSLEEIRSTVAEFLGTDVFSLSAELCVSLLDALIEAWDIDLATFALDVVVNPRVGPARVARFEFVERKPAPSSEEEAGFTAFLKDNALSGTANPDELAFLKQLKPPGKRPTAHYYYRELQNLRDPLHFSAVVGGSNAKGIRNGRPATDGPPATADS